MKKVNIFHKMKKVGVNNFRKIFVYADFFVCNIIIEKINVKKCKEKHVERKNM